MSRTVHIWPPGLDDDMTLAASGVDLRTVIEAA